jgi:hypothetical protein
MPLPDYEIVVDKQMKKQAWNKIKHNRIWARAQQTRQHRNINNEGKNWSSMLTNICFLFVCCYVLEFVFLFFYCLFVSLFYTSANTELLLSLGNYCCIWNKLVKIEYD